jgi:hypothetical protein
MMQYSASGILMLDIKYEDSGHQDPEMHHPVPRFPAFGNLDPGFTDVGIQDSCIEDPQSWTQGSGSWIVDSRMLEFMIPICSIREPGRGHYALRASRGTLRP